jgi:hypothetical protein
MRAPAARGWKLTLLAPTEPGRRNRRPVDAARTTSFPSPATRPAPALTETEGSGDPGSRARSIDPAPLDPGEQTYRSRRRPAAWRRVRTAATEVARFGKPIRYVRMIFLAATRRVSRLRGRLGGRRRRSDRRAGLTSHRRWIRRRPRRFAATPTRHPAHIPQEGAGSSRRHPAIPATSTLERPAHGGNPRLFPLMPEAP